MYTKYEKRFISDCLERAYTICPNGTFVLDTSSFLTFNQIIEKYKWYVKHCPTYSGSVDYLKNYLSYFYDIQPSSEKVNSVKFKTKLCKGYACSNHINVLTVIKHESPFGLSTYGDNYYVYCSFSHSFHIHTVLSNNNKTFVDNDAISNTVYSQIYKKYTKTIGNWVMFYVHCKQDGEMCDVFKYLMKYYIN